MNTIEPRRLSTARPEPSPARPEPVEGQEISLTPKDLLKALEERFRLYQVLKEEGLVNRNKAQSIQTQITTAMHEIEELLKT